jgi:hypothetical protein
VRETADLGLVEGFSTDCFYSMEGLGNSLALKDFVLAEEEPVLKCELGEREAYYELLPWEEGTVEPAG